MAFTFRKDKVDHEEPRERSGDWYPDPYGDGARRWYDEGRGWTDRVQGAGQEPEKTGLPRTDEAAATDGSAERVDADGNPARLSRPVDPEILGHT